MAARRFTGTIVWFDYARGFGSVLVAGLARKAFVNIAEFPAEVNRHNLGRGTKVEFYLANGTKGLKCVRANIV
jgi:cold shock CspA family protein